jgi:hypothetical protein
VLTRNGRLPGRGLRRLFWFGRGLRLGLSRGRGLGGRWGCRGRNLGRNFGGRAFCGGRWNRRGGGRLGLQGHISQLNNLRICATRLFSVRSRSSRNSYLRTFVAQRPCHGRNPTNLNPATNCLIVRCDPHTTLRRGWFLGNRQFRREFAGADGRAAGPVAFGEELKQSAEERAEAIIAGELKRKGWEEKELETRRKGDPFKVRLAERLRSETTMPLQWIAQRLRMGTRGHLTHLLYWRRRSKPKPDKR